MSVPHGTNQLRLTIVRDEAGLEILHLEHDGQAVTALLRARRWDDSDPELVRVTLEFERPAPLKAKPA